MPVGLLEVGRASATPRPGGRSGMSAFAAGQARDALRLVQAQPVLGRWPLLAGQGVGLVHLAQDFEQVPALVGEIIDHLDEAPARVHQAVRQDGLELPGQIPRWLVQLLPSCRRGLASISRDRPLRLLDHPAMVTQEAPLHRNPELGQMVLASGARTLANTLDGRRDPVIRAFSNQDRALQVAMAKTAGICGHGWRARCGTKAARRVRWRALADGSSARGRLKS
jgi:hypothetical protein